MCNYQILKVFRGKKEDDRVNLCRERAMLLGEVVVHRLCRAVEQAMVHLQRFQGDTDL